jgi:hypothetical protein
MILKNLLHEEDLMICDEKDPLCIAGVMENQSKGAYHPIFPESVF